MFGKTYGGEIGIDFQVLNWWRLKAAYSYLNIELSLTEKGKSSAELLKQVTGDETLAKFALGTEGESPHNQAHLNMWFNLKKDVEFDLGLRYVDNMPTLKVNRYFNLDLRLGWKPIKNLEMSICGQNLLSPHHLEYQPSYGDILNAEVERGYYGKLTWTF